RGRLARRGMGKIGWGCGMRHHTCGTLSHGGIIRSLGASPVVLLESGRPGLGHDVRTTLPTSRRRSAEITSEPDRLGPGTRGRLVEATGGTSVELSPGSDVHRALADVRSGADVVLHPGDHVVTSTITIGGGGRPGAPAVIRGAGAHARPRIVCRDRM